MTASFDIRDSAFAISPVPPKGNANFAWVQHFTGNAKTTAPEKRSFDHGQN